MGALGPRVHGHYKSKVSRGHAWSYTSQFGTYGRGNFPGHDVLWTIPQMTKNVCRRVMMHKNTCNGAYIHGGKEKQDKKNPQWTSMTCFMMYGRGSKKQEGGRYDRGDQRVSRGAKKFKKGVRITRKMCLDNKKARKQSDRQNAAPKQGHAICQPTKKNKGKRVSRK